MELRSLGDVKKYFQAAKSALKLVSHVMSATLTTLGTGIAVVLTTAAANAQRFQIALRWNNVQAATSMYVTSAKRVSTSLWVAASSATLIGNASIFDYDLRFEEWGIWKLVMKSICDI